MTTARVGSLAGHFVAHAAPEAEQLDRAELAAALAALLMVVRARWPGVLREDAPAVAALAAAWVPDAAAPHALELPPFAAELVLAQTCVRGERAAIEAFSREMFVHADRALGRLRLAPGDLDDVRQEVHAKLLVGAPPKLAQYEGTGPLAHWVASVAVREGLILMRRQRRSHTIEDTDALVDDQDPELALLRARHGADFKAAFQAAVAALPARARMVLRALLVDDRSVNDIAALYKIHRVTASRWLSDIRDTLLRDTRRRLQHTLQLDPPSLDSAVRVVAADLELSLFRLLAAPG